MRPDGSSHQSQLLPLPVTQPQAHLRGSQPRLRGFSFFPGHVCPRRSCHMAPGMAARRLPLLCRRNSQTHEKAPKTKARLAQALQRHRGTWCPQDPCLGAGPGGRQSWMLERADSCPHPEQDVPRDDPWAPWHLTKALVISSPVLSPPTSAIAAPSFSRMPACSLAPPQACGVHAFLPLHQGLPQHPQHVHVHAVCPQNIPERQGSSFCLHLPLCQSLPGCGGHRAQE